MGHRNRWATAFALIAVVVVAVLPVAGCSSAPAAGSPASEVEVSKVEPVAGSNVATVTLSSDAARRLGIQTSVVGETMVAGLMRKVVPYSAVLYDPAGKTYAYSNPRSLAYVRVPLAVDFVDGELAVLTAGPPSGTTVVTVGASELFGTEFEVGGE
ncbi:MAG: hypothetical protein ACRDS0_32100 [Pseudonocardiaceae bacterium]